MSPELLSAVVAELNAALPGAVLSSVHQNDERQLLLRLYLKGSSVTLLLSIHPSRCRLHLTERSYRNPAVPLRFCAYLRARLIGAILTEITHRTGAHIGSLSFRKRYGDESRSFTLVYEFTGKSSNVILVDDGGIVLDAMRYFPPEKGHPRVVAPRLPFTPLPPPPSEGGAEKSRVLKGSHATWNEAADTHFAVLEEEELFTKEKGSARRALKRWTQHTERKATNLKGDRKRAEAYIEESRRGDLLLANFNRIDKGMTEIIVDDYEADPPGKVRIPLEETLDGAENIDRIFQRAKKGKKALKILGQRIPEVEGELLRVADLTTRLEKALRIQELTPITNELRKAGYLNEECKRREQRGPAEPVRRFTSSEGLEILCGKNDAGNDLLLRKYARGNDLWFHAADVAGSHTLLRLRERGKAPPRKAVEEAASIAAFYSKAQGEKRAPVSYTRAKEVKKPKGAKAGLVIITHYKTITVPPWDGKS